MHRLEQRDDNLQDIQEGWDVYDANDQQVGKVDGVEDGYILAHKGIFFPRDLYIPASAIARVADDRVYLNVVKDDVNDQQWDRVGTGRPAGQGTVTDTAVTMDAPRHRATVGRNAEHVAAKREASVPGPEGEQTIHLHEEQLRATKERVPAGEVRIGKDVVEEQMTIDVPVTREEVVIERTPGDRRPDDHRIGEGAEETIRVPVSEERVDVEKVAVETEEVRVGTREVTEQRQVTDTVRREEARIENEGDVRVQGEERTPRPGQGKPRQGQGTPRPPGSGR